MTVYVEPVGYGYGAGGSDDTIAFGIGLVIENTTGQVLVDAPEAFSVAAASPEGNRNFGMTLSVVVPFIRPGEYKAVFSGRRPELGEARDLRDSLDGRFPAWQRWRGKRFAAIPQKSLPLRK